MGVCLLVVNEDMACRDIVSHLLNICSYSEVHTGMLEDTLGVISDKRLPEKNPALLSNLKWLGKRGRGILLQVRRFFNSPTEKVVFYDMKTDAKGFKPKIGEQLSCSLYILNISGHEQIETLWKSTIVINNRFNMLEVCDSEPDFGASAAENTANSAKAAEPSAAVDEKKGKSI